MLQKSIIFTYFVIVMILTVLNVCPICAQNNLVEMNQVLIRSSDEVICENEHVLHLRRGRTEMIVHTQFNIQEERAVSSMIAA